MVISPSFTFLPLNMKVGVELMLADLIAFSTRAFRAVAAFSSDLYRVPYLVERGVFAIASLVVLAAALASAFAILSRIKNLDMIEVLKTRE